MCAVTIFKIILSILGDTERTELKYLNKDQRQQFEVVFFWSNYKLAILDDT